MNERSADSGSPDSIEQALRESEERFRILADNIPGLVYLCATDARFSMIYVNDAVEELTGYSKADFVQQRVSLTQLTHEEDRSRVAGTIEAALARRERFHVEYRARHRSGEWRWFTEDGVGVFRDGQLLYLEGYVRDVTCDRQSEEEREERLRLDAFTARIGLLATRAGNLRAGLQRCAEEMTTHLDAALARIWTLNVRDQVLELQASAGIRTRIDGAYARIPVGRHGIGQIARDRKPHMTNAVAGADGVHDLEWAQREGLVSFAGLPLVVGEELVGVVALFSRQPLSDGAARAMKVAADAIALGIAHEQAEHGRQVLEARLQQAQKLESLGVLAGGIAHDFNNLLVGILGNTGLALLDLDPSSPAYSLLEEAEKAAQRAAELAHQMLAYSGKGNFLIHSFQLDDLAVETGEAIRPNLSRGATLEFDLAENLPAMDGDAAQVRQVIRNLLTNASDSMSDQGGRITVRTGTLVADRESLASIYQTEPLPEGEYVFLEVIDTGCGMDEPTRLKVFDPFFTTKVSGRGLGLAVVLGIVRAHHGVIQIESAPGRGSTVRVLFPASSGRAEVPASEPESAGDWRGEGVILVVDDEDTVRKLVVNCLKRVGFEVLEACDGNQAVEVYRSQCDRIRAVLLDLTMPEKDGVQTYAELRGIREDVRVILTSGYNEPEFTERISGHGSRRFLKKPYHPRELVDAVRNVLES